MHLLGRWAFAALSRIDTSASDADTSATIRSLYVACTAMRQRLAGCCSDGGRGDGRDWSPTACGSATSPLACGSATSGTATALGDLPLGLQRRVASLNVLITITGGCFHQAPREEWQGDED